MDIEEGLAERIRMVVTRPGLDVLNNVLRPTLPSGAQAG